MVTADFVLNPAQQQVIEHGLLSSGFSCVLQMPTGSGKTWLASRAMEDAIASGKRAVYLTPLRALAEELVVSWRARLGDDKVGIFTGDYTRAGKKLPLPYQDAQLLIMTPERLDACTRNWRTHWSWIPELDLMVVDELHLLGDSGRGARLEGTIGRVRRLNPFCRFLGLSATLGNRGELADWLGGVEFESTWRPVTLAWRVARYRKADEKPDLLVSELRPTVAAGGQSLVFVQSRRRSEQLARLLMDHGIAADHHHAGLEQGARRSAEEGFRSRRIQVLVATGTLEMGLNLPARQVILYDLQGFNGSTFEPLTTNTVWQRAGRAGRPGLDDQGEVVLLAPVWDRDVQRYSEGRFERIESGLRDPAALAEQILVEVQAGFARSSVQLDRAFALSLSNQQGPLNIANALREMIDAGMLRIDRDEQELLGEETLVATRLGRVATRHLLRPATVLSLRQFLQRQPRWTHLDLLVAAAATQDCEPRISVDFEELEELSDQLGRFPSHLFAMTSGQGSWALGMTGKALLSALKTAVVLLRWTELGDIERTAAELECYPYELQRLQESMERLLLAASCVQHLLEDGHNGKDTEDVSDGDSRQMRSIAVLQQMIHCGLGEQAASLTLVPGIGAKWARKLIAAGISDLPRLARATPYQLVQVGGVSEERASKWIHSAKGMEPLHASVSSETTDCIRAELSAWTFPVDPYRLRRALDLKVEIRTSSNWLVTGGLEPHHVDSPQGNLLCDCPDHAKGHECKHILAVKLAQDDPTLKKALGQIRSLPKPHHLDLLALWFDRNGGPR